MDSYYNNSTGNTQTVMCTGNRMLSLLFFIIISNSMTYPQPQSYKCTCIWLRWPIECCTSGKNFVTVLATYVWTKVVKSQKVVKFYMHISLVFTCLVITRYT